MHPLGAILEPGSEGLNMWSGTAKDSTGFSMHSEGLSTLMRSKLFMLLIPINNSKRSLESSLYMSFCS